MSTTGSLQRSALRAAGLAVALMLLAPPAEASRQLWATGAHRYSNFGSALSAAGDFNGDGFGDFILGAPSIYLGEPGPGRAWVYLGAPQGDNPSRLTLLGVDTAELFGSAVTGAGDLDADGFSDVVASSATRVCVYRGGSPPDTSIDLQIPAGPGQFGSTLAPAGDWNGDGYDDFMIGAPLDSTAGAGGRVFVYFGGATLDGTPDAVLQGGAIRDQFGRSLAGGVDVNGDGFDDLVVGAPLADDTGAGLTDCGEVRVFFGGPSFDSTADLIIKGMRAADRLGTSVALLADFNADGAGDIAAGAPQPPGRGRIFVFDGGPSLDGLPDWTVGTEGTGVWLAAGDVNRDHISDIVTSDIFNPQLIYFGGAVADTLPDSPLSVPFSQSFGGAVIAAAGDVNGDGYDEWLLGKSVGFGPFSSIFVGLFTAHGDLQLIAPNGGGDQHLLGGADYLVNWAGPQIADIEYARDGTTWQKLGIGAGGAASNTATVTIPVGRAIRTARMRVVNSAPGDTIIDPGDYSFSVDDSVQTLCFGTTASPTGTGVTWSAEWPGFPGAAHLYRLFRRDGNGPEFTVGPDTLTEEGWLDTGGSTGSRYRLVALPPNGVPTSVDSVTRGAFSCDSIHLETPNGGESLFLGNTLNVIWVGTRPVDVLLSRNEGATWDTVQVNVQPPSTYFTGTSPATSHARIRTAIHGVDGAVFDESDASFTIRTDIQLQAIAASPAGGGGMTIAWQTDPVADPQTTFLGYRLCRDDTTAGAPAIGPWPNSGTGYVDPAGTPQSLYKLWAVLNTYQELPLGTVGPNLPVPTPPPTTTFGPSPVGAHNEVALSMPSPTTATGSATDVEVRVYDLRGRDVALLGRNLGTGGTVNVKWTPAAHGLRAGIYFMRVRSASARFEQTHRIVVL